MLFGKRCDQISVMRPENLAHTDLNLLVVLHSLLQTRSLTKTAATLGISQPAASRALAKLRVVFGDRLLVRGAGAMVPTQRAEDLAQPLSALLSQIEALIAAPIFDPASTDRLFRIATTDYGALAVLPGLMERFTREAPRAAVEIVQFSQEVFRSLADGHAANAGAPQRLQLQASLARALAYRSGRRLAAAARS